MMAIDRKTVADDVSDNRWDAAADYCVPVIEKINKSQRKSPLSTRQYFDLVSQAFVAGYDYAAERACTELLAENTALHDQLLSIQWEAKGRPETGPIDPLTEEEERDSN